MKICLVAPNDAVADPRARVMRHVLERAGHDVSVVIPRPGPPEDGVIRTTVGATRPSRLRRLFGSTPSSEQRTAELADALARSAASTGADIFIPTDPRALDATIRAARATDGVVSRAPNMPDAGDVDLVGLAPRHPDLASPMHGIGAFHTPADPRAPYRPQPGRHRDRSVILCYRRSEINPGRYLEQGLVRSGARVRVETERIDLSSIDPSTDFVVFVEGPYPALEVSGDTEVPVLFWFHHGEHHLHANLRLADRYRADALLMAHSWHLAYWSPLPVHRFPFGVATELLDPSRPHSERRYDVAMVGAKLRSGGPYGRRQKLVAELETALPGDRLGFREAVTADEMADLYGNSRIVINEGGTRHYPITMRVLEAVGSGAVLLSDTLPGMEMLLDEGTQYATLGTDVVADVETLLADPDRLQGTADSALERAMGLHTYDHRVDELFEITAGTRKRNRREAGELTTLASVIDRDVEVQRVAQLGAADLVDQLPSREVWDASTLPPARLGRGKMETIAVRRDDLSGLDELLLAARRYIYIEGEGVGVEEFVNRHAPQSRIEAHHGVIRIDLLAPSYRIMPFELNQT